MAAFVVAEFPPFVLCIVDARSDKSILLSSDAVGR